MNNIQKKIEKPFRRMFLDAPSPTRTLHDMSKNFWIATLLFSGLLLAACSSPHEFSGNEFASPVSAPEIAGVVGNETFNLSGLQDKVVVVFFGFTFCPDICPMTMAEVRQAYEQSGATPEDVSVVFVTVDPERDTPERLAEYVSAFDSDFYGVHVPLADQEAVKKNYFVFAEKDFGEGETDSDDYLIAHSDNIYLIDQEGNLRVVYRGGDLVVEDFAADIEHLVAN